MMVVHVKHIVDKLPVRQYLCFKIANAVPLADDVNFFKGFLAQHFEVRFVIRVLAVYRKFHSTKSEMSNKDRHYKKGIKHYESGKFEDAIYSFTLAVSIDQNDADLFSERGVAYFHHGKLKEALADMDRARDLEPNNPYRYSSRAYIRDAMGDLDGAVKDYQQAIFLDPDDAVAHNNLGMLEEKSGRHNKAMALYALADQLAGDTPGIQASRSIYPSSGPENIQSNINRERGKKTLWTEMRNVFASREAFGDFITFVRNGFK